MFGIFSKKKKLQGKSAETLTNWNGDRFAGLYNALKSNGSAVWDQWGKSEQLDMYGVNSVVFACSRRRFSSLIEAPLKTGVIVDGVFEDVETPIDAILENPAPMMDLEKWLSFYLSSKDLSGFAYYLKMRNEAGELIGLQPIPSDCVGDYWKGADGKPLGYKMTINGAQYSVPFRDIGKDYYIDPRNPAGGMGLLQAAARDTQQDIERATYLQEMLENNKLPGVIFKNNDGWSPDQKDDVKRHLENTQGKGKRGGAMFVDGEVVDVQSIAPLADLDWPGLSSLSESRICSAFGVPPQIVGVRAGLEAGTFANYEQAEKTFYRGTMVGVWNAIETYLTRNLFIEEGYTAENGFDDFVVKFDTRFVRQLQEDQNERHDRIRKDFQGGLLSREDAQKALGYDPEEGDFGKEYLVPGALIPTIPGEDPDRDEGVDNGSDSF